MINIGFAPMFLMLVAPISEFPRAFSNIPGSPKEPAGWALAFHVRLPSEVQFGGLEEPGRSKLWLAPVRVQLCGAHHPIPPDTFSHASGGNSRDAPAGRLWKIWKIWRFQNGGYPKTMANFWLVISSLCWSNWSLVNPKCGVFGTGLPQNQWGSLQPFSPIPWVSKG